MQTQTTNTIPQSEKTAEIPLSIRQKADAHDANLISRLIERAENTMVMREYRIWAPAYVRELRAIQLCSASGYEKQAEYHSDRAHMIARFLNSLAKIGEFNLSGIMTIGLHVDLEPHPTDAAIAKFAKSEGIDLNADPKKQEAQAPGSEGIKKTEAEPSAAEALQHA